MDYRLRARLEIAGLAAASKYRFCSGFDVIVETLTEEEACHLLAAAVLLSEPGMTRPYRID